MTPILFRDVKHHIQGFTGKRELGQDLNLASYPRVYREEGAGAGFEPGSDGLSPNQELGARGWGGVVVKV